MPGTKKLDVLLLLWYIALLVSIIGCFRAVTSIALILIIATGFFKTRVETGKWFSGRLSHTFLIACTLFYLLQLVGLIITPGGNITRQLQLKSALIFVPLAVCCCSFVNDKSRKKLMIYFTWFAAVAMLACIAVAAYNYFVLQLPKDVFFYHKLVIPLKEHHAVQVSILVFSALLFVLEQTKNGSAFKHISFNYLLIIFLTASLLLLSSKLVIGFTFIIFLYYVFLGIRRGNAKAIVASSLGALLLITIILSFQNKISSRFKEITSGDLRLLKQKDFDPGTYFNGLQFRVLQVRFVREILDEQNAWFTGVNPNMQELLDEKYIETKMYTGDGITEDRGYLGLNTHNQFLESLLQSGWPGLIAFGLTCLALIRMAFRRKNRELTITIILLLLYCLNESVFETQYGLILYTFLPMFLYYGTARSGQRRRRRKVKLVEITHNNHLHS